MIPISLTVGKKEGRLIKCARAVSAQISVGLKRGSSMVFLK